MATEPFRYDQQVLDVSDMNMTSGLRNSLTPSMGSVRLGLSGADWDALGRSADGVTSLLTSDSTSGSSPALMAAHHKAMNSSLNTSQLAPPLSASVFAAGLPSISSANVSAVLSSINSQGARDSPLINSMGEVGQNITSRDPFVQPGSRNGNNNGGTGASGAGSSSSSSGAPQPIIQVPSSLQSSGPTLSEAMAMGVDAETLQRAMQQAALQTSQQGQHFSIAHYLQQQSQQSPATPSSTNAAHLLPTTPSGSTPIVTASGQLRYSGDRFASSAFSPVSPGGSSGTASKISAIGYTPATTPGAQILSPGSNAAGGGTNVLNPLAQMTAGMSPLQFAPATPQSMVSTPYTPGGTSNGVASSSSGYSGSVPSPSVSSYDGSQSSGMGAYEAGAGGVPPPHKRPYMGAGTNGDPNATHYGAPGLHHGSPGLHQTAQQAHVLHAHHHMGHMHGHRDGTSSDDSSSLTTPNNGTLNSASSSGSSATAAAHQAAAHLAHAAAAGTAGVGGMYSPEDVRTQALLQSLNTFSNGLALANNAVKQENMIQEHMLGHGVLQGPASAAFTYQGKAIPYSEEAARQHYMMLEESKKAELAHIQTHLGRVKKNEALAKGIDDNFLGDSHLEHRKIKKLHPLTYDALYRSVTANLDGAREKYLVNEHPQVDSLLQLPGRVYILQVSKGSRKPPHVGFPFRSYSDSHYTSVDRENPVICKVKEWPVDNDPKNIWRLYHYYLGNKKRAPRTGSKRRRNDDPSADD